MNTTGRTMLLHGMPMTEKILDGTERRRAFRVALKNTRFWLRRSHRRYHWATMWRVMRMDWRIALTGRSWVVDYSREIQWDERFR